MSSFLYPRTISITRSAVNAELGQSPYSGETSAKEACVVESVPASIQFKRPSGKPEPGLPTDTSSKTSWRIFIPFAALANGVVNVRDIVTDDLGIRYQVTSPYWNSLGYALTAERLEA